MQSEQDLYVKEAPCTQRALRCVELCDVIETPWSFALTAIFLATAVLCALQLAHSRDASAGDSRARSRRDGAISTAVHLNHLVMSLAMLLMVWLPVGAVGTWVQVVIFALFGLLMLSGLPSEASANARIGLSSHVLLNVAMIWMLLAMPLLMGHARGDSDGANAAHHGDVPDDAMAMETLAPPAWASGVNYAAVALSALIALWWTTRLLREPGHRLHTACHLLMAGGMYLMLALM